MRVRRGFATAWKALVFLTLDHLTEPTVTKLPSYQTTKLPNYQTTKLPNYQTAQLCTSFLVLYDWLVWVGSGIIAWYFSAFDLGILLCLQFLLPLMPTH